jgi:hypothetical protein
MLILTFLTQLILRGWIIVIMFGQEY